MPTLLAARTAASAAALFAAAAAPAQGTATVPAALAGVEGGSSSSIPFGFNQPVRVQCIYDAEELPWTGPRLINVVSFRADNTTDNVTAFAQKGFVVVSMLLSSTARRAAAASATFADNRGSDATWVLVNQPIMLPAQPAQAGVRAANIDFVLPVPWFHGLLPTRPGAGPRENGLLIELQISSQPTGSYRLDNVGSCQSPSSPFGNVGPLCAPAGGSPLLVTPDPSMVAGASFRWQISHAEPNALVLLTVDVTNQGLLLGAPTLPLPVPLFDPAAPTRMFPPLQALMPTLTAPAADCWFNLSPQNLLATVADQAGVANLTVNLAAGRGYVGSSLFVQALAYSQTANPLLFVTSAGRQTTVCGPLSVARVYNLGNATAATGQISIGQGPVVELR